jgi:hypothetical protein
MYYLSGRQRIIIGDIHHNIGMAELARGRGYLEDAGEHLSESYRIFASALGEEHVKSARARELLEL